MSWLMEVQVFGEDGWYPNGIRLATEREAKAYAWHKACTWTLVKDTRVRESDDPVNYRWDPDTSQLLDVAPSRPIAQEDSHA